MSFYLRAGLAVSVAYVVACFSASETALVFDAWKTPLAFLTWDFWVSTIFAPTDALEQITVVLIFSFPGFLALRSGLYSAGRWRFRYFVIAGILNGLWAGYITGSISENLVFLIVGGAVAGTVYHLVERLLLPGRMTLGAPGREAAEAGPPLGGNGGSDGVGK